MSLSKKDEHNSTSMGSQDIQVSAVEAQELSGKHGHKPHDVEVAAQFLSNLDPAILAEPISAKESRKLLWKIDLVILPLIAGTVILTAVDKAIISNAANFGMKTDTNLVGDQFSWVGSIFYFGYLFFEYPSAYLIQRLRIAKFLSFAVFGCGVLLMCTAATQNFAGLAVVRFIMGMLEAPVFPVSSILTVMWYSTAEQPIRAAFWNNQIASIFMGIIGFAIGSTNTYLHPWRIMYLLLGGITILWSILLWFCLPDSPVNCWFMTERERYISLERVRDNNTGVEDKTIKWYQIRECLLDPKTWLLWLFSVAQNIPNGALVTFAAVIVKGFGFDPLRAALLGMPTGVVATSWQLLLSIPAARFKNVRCIIIASSNIIPIICASLEWKLSSSEKGALLAIYYIFYTYWGAYVVSTSLPMANVSGHTKKLTMNATIFLAYCLGNIIGPQVFRSELAPSYTASYEGLLACLVVASASIIAYGLLCHFENRKRDREQAGQEIEEHDQFSDLTDKEKKAFRYTY